MTDPATTHAPAAPGTRPSNGLGWAFAMLAFMVLELLVFFDVRAAGWNPAIRVIFAVKATFTAVQVAGIGLVAARLYRTGGVLQMIASAIHVLELLGIIGIIGGKKAYAYPRLVAAESATAGPKPGSPPW
jgi:hypothetical protein